MQQTLGGWLNDRLYRRRFPLELLLQHDIDAALGDGRVARAGLADRHLPQYRWADAVLCQFVGDDLAARLGEPLVSGGRAGGAGARFDADGAAAGLADALRGIGDNGMRFRCQIGAELVEKDEKAASVGARRRAAGDKCQEQRTGQNASDARHERTIARVAVECRNLSHRVLRHHDDCDGLAARWRAWNSAPRASLDRIREAICASSSSVSRPSGKRCWKPLSAAAIRSPVCLPRRKSRARAPTRWSPPPRSGNFRSTASRNTPPRRRWRRSNHATPILASWLMCCCSRRLNSARSRSTS